MVNLIEKIGACANGYRHKHYHRTVDLAEIYEKIVTTHNQESLVISYHPSESTEQKKQRIEIYKSETPSVVHQVMTQFDYVKGAPRIVDSIDFSGGGVSPAQQEAINLAVSFFYGKQTLQQYLEEKQRHYSQLDPNAWLIVNVINGKPHPATVCAENALDFVVIGGITEYLIVLSTEKTSNGELKNYFGYQKGERIVALDADINNPALKMMDNALYATFTIDEKQYKIYKSVDDTDETPAIRFGYAPDDTTNGQTFVGIFDPVKEKMKDLINQKSEYDLSLNLHVFLKKYAFVDPCDYSPENQPHVRCKGGRLYPTGGDCPSCRGSGVKLHASSQDVVLVKKPQEGEPLQLKLSEQVYYVTMPFEIVEHQAKRIDSLKKEIPKFIFGVDLESRSSGIKTATEITNFFDSVYMTISSFAEKISQNFKFCVISTAQLMGIKGKIVVDHRYPTTFKMETLAELTTILDQIMKSGANSEISWGIEQRIMELQNKDNPNAIKLQKIKRIFMPFKNLANSERIAAIAELPFDHKYRVLHTFSDIIFARIIDKRPNFILLSTKDQQSIIDEEVAIIQKEVKPIIPTLETPQA